jgi:hypothetical protein
VRGARNGDVGKFLAVAENAELCLAAQHLAATDDRSLPALVGKAVILDDLFFFEGKRNRALLFGHKSLSLCGVEGIITNEMLYFPACPILFTSFKPNSRPA